MDNYNPNCLFCKISIGEIKSKNVYEDEEFVAFYDIYPVANTHVLIIPRKHISTLSSVNVNDAPLLGKMLLLVAHIAEILGVSDTGKDTSGFRTVINTGKGAGQEVRHLHAHILAGPRPWDRMD
ncbi:MAG: histidine triad nucleotide-binding protein [Burkholderia sp.]|nr:histidine triad nucleotide-binding protein [Burkholderia sp.]